MSDDDLTGNTRLRCISRSVKVPRNADAVDQKQLMQVMQQFGINHKRSAQHMYFWKSCLEKARDCRTKSMTSQGCYFPMPHHSLLPTDPFASIRYVFAQEIEHLHNCCKEVVDELFEAKNIPSFGLPPYMWDAQDGMYNKRRDEFMFLSEDEIDPFNRFSFVEKSFEDLIRDQWSSLRGYEYCIFKALVGSLACHATTCFKCKAPELRWNSGEHESTYWRKIVCANCNSVYEIKDTYNVDPESHVVIGTSLLSYFYAVENSIHGTDASQFIIIVDKTPRRGQPGWSVYVAEVSKVVPGLKPRSFDTTKIRIFSKTFHETPTLWFRIPPLDLSAVPEIAQRVLDEFFSRAPSDADVFAVPNERPAVVKPLSLDEIRTHLRSLRKERMQILGLEKRAQRGETLSKSEQSQLTTKQDVLTEIAKAERRMKDLL